MTTHTNNSERLVSCSFCDEKFSPSEMGAHLMMCGNKTDQCPNCRKYIRRAVFAYHYENNCTNLDEFDADVSAAANQPDASSTFQPNNPLSSSSGLTAGDNKRVSLMKVNLATHPKSYSATSQQSNSDFCETKRITIVCSFCKQKCEIGEGEIHQENCLQNPVNTKKRQLSCINGTSNQSSDPLHHEDQLNDTATVPCEICKQLIEWRCFKEHLKDCVEREQKRRQNQPRPFNEEVDSLIARCKYCTEERSVAGLKFHELICSKNVCSALKTGFKRAFRLPPLQN